MVTATGKVRSSMKQHRTRVRESAASRTFDVFNYIFLALLGVATLGPFLYLLLGSLTQATYFRQVGVAVNPAQWTLNSYRILLGSASRIYQALKVTLFVTVAGTLVSLTTTAAMAYGLSRRTLIGRSVLVFVVFFTMLFGGGMVPLFLVVRGLGLVDSLWSLILPFMINAWYVFIMMRFFEALPQDLMDSARIDGCSGLGVFVRIVLPLSKPVLATIGLFYAVGYWTIFLIDPRLQPLQLVLRGILAQLLLVVDPETAMEAAKMDAQSMPPMEVLRMAAIIVTVLPITLVYPFLQRHFVKGVMVGAIKG